MLAIISAPRQRSEPNQRTTRSHARYSSVGAELRPRGDQRPRVEHGLAVGGIAGLVGHGGRPPDRVKSHHRCGPGCVATPSRAASAAACCARERNASRHCWPGELRSDRDLLRRPRAGRSGGACARLSARLALVGEAGNRPAGGRAPGHHLRQTGLRRLEPTERGLRLHHAVARSGCAYDKLAVRYEATLQIAAINEWLPAYDPRPSCSGGRSGSGCHRCRRALLWSPAPCPWAPG
jgi:hypothetical protein